MGSGCQSDDCKDNIPCNPLVYDECVKYTGEAIPSLDICTGDTLKEILAILLEWIQEQEKTHPEIADICDKLQEIIGENNPTILNIVEALARFSCSLQSDLEDIQDILNKEPFQYNLYCLSITGVLKTETILQALIKAHCQLRADVDALQDRVDDLEENMQDKITLQSNNPWAISQDGSTYTLSGFLQPYIPLPYIGPLSNFDASGKGIASKGWENWYILNGLNGTPDWRGFYFSGSTSTPGGALNSLVNPQIQGTQYSSSPGDTKGKVKTTILASNLPDHEHDASVSINDPGHSHTYMNWPNTGDLGKGGSTATRNNVASTKTTSVETTGITVDVTVSRVKDVQNLPIDNRPPTKYGIWIVWIPAGTSI